MRRSEACSVLAATLSSDCWTLTLHAGQALAFADVLIRVQSYPASRIDEMLPHNWSLPSQAPPPQ